jgi:hypothetical protein
MNVLVMNPGGNSLKVEIVSCLRTQQLASDGKKLVSLILEGIGKAPCLSVLDGKNPRTPSQYQQRTMAKRQPAFFVGWKMKNTSLLKTFIA